MRGLRRPPSITCRMAGDSSVTSSVGSGDGDKAIARTVEILVVLEVDRRRETEENTVREPPQESWVRQPGTSE